MDAWLRSSYHDIIWAGQPFSTILVGLDEAVQRMTVEVNAEKEGGVMQAHIELTPVEIAC